MAQTWRDLTIGSGKSECLKCGVTKVPKIVILTLAHFGSACESLVGEDAEVYDGKCDEPG